jgi:hypothetical protein
MTNEQILLAARPDGWMKESDFRVVETRRHSLPKARCCSRISISRSILICAAP